MADFAAAPLRAPVTRGLGAPVPPPQVAVEILFTLLPSQSLTTT